MTTKQKIPSPQAGKTDAASERHGAATRSDDLREYRARTLALLKRQVEALERIVYLIDHWPVG